MATHESVINRRTLLTYAFVLGTGISVGSISRQRISSDAAAFVASPNATATRIAELEELHAFQTEVAQPLVCTPAPTNTALPPTPTVTQVPAAQTGVPLPYNGIWTITVLVIAPAISPNDYAPTGKLMQVNMTALQSTASPQFPSLTDFRLVDNTGRYTVPDLSLNQELFGSGWGLHIQPGVPANVSIVFDVAADVGDSFILESNADPTFRVAMTVEQRG